MTKAQYGGLVGGIVGGLIVMFWQWRRQMAADEATRDRGEVIFSNAPRPSEP